MMTPYLHQVKGQLPCPLQNHFSDRYATEGQIWDHICCSTTAGGGVGRRRWRQWFWFQSDSWCDGEGAAAHTDWAEQRAAASAVRWTFNQNMIRTFHLNQTDVGWTVPWCIAVSQLKSFKYQKTTFDLWKNILVHESQLHNNNNKSHNCRTITQQRLEQACGTEQYEIL